jgi:hypothetical protein
MLTDSNVSSARAADAQPWPVIHTSHPSGVSDSSDNLSAQIDDLALNPRRISGILVSDSKQPIGITVAQFASDATALSKVIGSYSLNVTNATSGDVATLSANNKVVSMQVTDTTANVQANVGDIVANGPKLGSL